VVGWWVWVGTVSVVVGKGVWRRMGLCLFAGGSGSVVVVVGGIVVMVVVVVLVVVIGAVLGVVVRRRGAVGRWIVGPRGLFGVVIEFVVGRHWCCVLRMGLLRIY